MILKKKRGCSPQLTRQKSNFRFQIAANCCHQNQIKKRRNAKNRTGLGQFLLTLQLSIQMCASMAVTSENTV